MAVNLLSLKKNMQLNCVHFITLVNNSIIYIMYVLNLLCRILQCMLIYGSFTIGNPDCTLHSVLMGLLYWIVTYHILLRVWQC